METLRYLPMIRSAGAELAFNQKKEEMEKKQKD